MKGFAQGLHMGKHKAEPSLTGISASIIEIISYTGIFAQVFIICWALFSATVCILTIHRALQDFWKSRPFKQANITE